MVPTHPPLLGFRQIFHKTDDVDKAPPVQRAMSLPRTDPFLSPGQSQMTPWIDSIWTACRRRRHYCR